MGKGKETRRAGFCRENLDSPLLRLTLFIAKFASLWPPQALHRTPTIDLLFDLDFILLTKFNLSKIASAHVQVLHSLNKATQLLYFRIQKRYTLSSFLKL
nr:hypothetical protein [Tanacetum cinerariifolium]